MKKLFKSVWDFPNSIRDYDRFARTYKRISAVIHIVTSKPEAELWPTNNAAFLKLYHPRGVIHSYVGGKIEDTGPLKKKRMETIDDETTNAAIGFMTRQNKAGKPFFVWMNFTRMHAFTHVRESMRGQSGMPGNEYADGMVEMDGDVGKLLKSVDDLGIKDNTIVIYTTDNEPNQWSWPDAASTPFRSEKDTNWEGAFRVPAVIRWPGPIKANIWSNEIVSGLDWFPTLLAAAGDTTVTERLLKGWSRTTGGDVYKVHLDGYNLLPYLEGKEAHSPRHEFYYFNDDGALVAVRFNNWKVVFCEQEKPGRFIVWSYPFLCGRTDKLFNLRMDPTERADIVSDQYYDWVVRNDFLLVGSQILAQKFMETLKEYPPSQPPASFSIDPEAIVKGAKAAAQKEKMKN